MTVPLIDFDDEISTLGNAAYTVMNRRCDSNCCPDASQCLIRCAKSGQLVEVRNHDWWGAPALGMLGPPAAAPQGSLRPRPAQQQARTVGCQWCKADDHAVKDCPLNEYFDEHFSPGTQQQEAKKQKGKGTACSLSYMSPQCFSSVLPKCCLSVTE